MPLAALLGISGLLFFLGYRFYSGRLAQWIGLRPEEPTPAHALEDGVDYVPLPRFPLLAQHFSAIAAAGPIVGPITACLQFGWVPCLLWVLFGAVLIGAAHDFSSLVISVRHRGRSIIEIVRETLGPRAWLALLAFVWIALIYVIIAFTHVTAATFVGRIHELEGKPVAFDRGGAVLLSSMLYLGLAIVLGLVQKFLRPPLWLATAIFVPATLGCVYLGMTLAPSWGLSVQTLSIGILGYCFVASLLPVWLLLQPRGYLGGFVLYAVLAVALIGIPLGSFEVRQEAFRGFTAPSPDGTGLLFPFLFVTIACGACSGFHGLVCTGTTSKQVDREPDCRPVGYGGMLLEGLVGVIALTTVMIASDRPAPPGAIYAEGIGAYLSAIIGREHALFAVTFSAMAFSTFVFDTLDVCTRLGRYVLQELFGWQGTGGAAAATALTIAVPFALVLLSPTEGWKKFWVLFGTSNQLLASLTLLVVTAWLHRNGRPSRFAAAPMLFILSVTFTSLGFHVVWIFRPPKAGETVITLINGIVAGALIALAAVMVLEAVRAVRRPAPAPQALGREP